jgi:hypothetical protein
MSFVETAIQGLSWQAKKIQICLKGFSFSLPLI